MNETQHLLIFKYVNKNVMEKTIVYLSGGQSEKLIRSKRFVLDFQERCTGLGTMKVGWTDGKSMYLSIIMT